MFCLLPNLQAPKFLWLVYCLHSSPLLSEVLDFSSIYEMSVIITSSLQQSSPSSQMIALLLSCDGLELLSVLWPASLLRNSYLKPSKSISIKFTNILSKKLETKEVTCMEVKKQRANQRLAEIEDEASVDFGNNQNQSHHIRSWRKWRKVQSSQLWLFLKKLRDFVLCNENLTITNLWTIFAFVHVKE